MNRLHKTGYDAAASKLPTRDGLEVICMYVTYEALGVAISFASLVVAIIAVCVNNKKD